MFSNSGLTIECDDTATITEVGSQEAADDIAKSYNVTLTSEQKTQGLEASYYKVVATQVGETTTYTMSVVLDKTEVGVDMGKTDEGVDTPVTFTDTNPTFKLKNSVKKGLYYSVGTVSDPSSSTIEFLAEQQATADGEAISLEVPSMVFDSGNVLYYKLSVSDTAQVE